MIQVSESESNFSKIVNFRCLNRIRSRFLWLRWETCRSAVHYSYKGGAGYVQAKCEFVQIGAMMMNLMFLPHRVPRSSLMVAIYLPWTESLQLHFQLITERVNIRCLTVVSCSSLPIFLFTLSENVWTGQYLALVLFCTFYLQAPCRYMSKFNKNWTYKWCIKYILWITPDLHGFVVHWNHSISTLEIVYNLAQVASVSIRLLLRFRSSRGRIPIAFLHQSVQFGGKWWLKQENGNLSEIKCWFLVWYHPRTAGKWI